MAKPGRTVGGSAHSPDEVAVEARLRPARLAEYVGQAALKERLGLFIEAARARQEALDHVLLYGPPGLGKTTLAHVIANELGVDIRLTSGPALDRPGDLASILSNLSEREVLFIDEIHRLSRQVEEVLYLAMEDFVLDVVLGKGLGAQTVRIQLPRFTLVGATTRAGLIGAPLRDRFGVMAHLDYYPPDDLALIAERTARVLNCRLQPEAAQEIARRSRGTPRVVNRLVRRLRDFAQVRGDGVLSLELVREGLDFLEVDPFGLDAVDRRLLSRIALHYAGGPVGLETLAASIGEEANTVEDVYEPYLLQQGFLQRTPRGRTLTARAYAHLGLKPPARPDGAGEQLTLAEMPAGEPPEAGNPLG